MAEKNFMSAVNESAAETARLARNAITQKVDQSAAETARLARQGSLAVGAALDQTAAETKRLNQYSHATNNIVPNADLANAGGLELNFEPNILDNFDAITYHLKFFMTTPAAATNGTILEANNQTVIAETGVTDLTIDNVEIRTLATPSLESGTGTATSVTFEITEPSGATMVDKIYYQSLALGIGNWSIAPFYLQVSFRSRDPVTSASIDDPTGSIDNLSWLYALKMGDIKADVTTAGTKYRCSAIIYNELLQQNIYSSIQQPIRLQNLSTFGQAMLDLENQLNADQLYKLIGTYSIPDSFKIYVDPLIEGYRITPPNSNTNSIRNNNFEAFDGKDATFPAGTSIDKIIDALLSNTQEYKKQLIRATVSGQEGQAANAETSQMKDFWRIYTEARPLKYDVRRSDNSREFTVYVYKYDIGVLDQNSAQTANGPETKESMRRRLVTYIKKGILKKSYNYIFTGLNDQIIDFSLNMNCAFAVGKARLGGVYSNVAQHDKGPVNQTNSRDQAELEKRLAQTISMLNDASATTGSQREAAITGTVASIQKSDLAPETKQRYLKILETAKSPNKLTALSQAQAAGGINDDGSINTNQFQSTNLAIKRNYTSTDPNVPSFITDVQIASPETRAAMLQYVEYNKGKLRPTVFVESFSDKAVGMGVESDSDAGIQKLSSMFSVALHGVYGGSLQQLKMTIKGDPFWLFPYPIEGKNLKLYNSLKSSTEAFQWLKTNHLISKSVNLAGTDNFFVLRFRSPRYYNQDFAGQEDALVDSDTFSGIYKLTEVINRFHNGKFEQDLSAVIDPELKISDFSKEIEDATRRNQTPTKPEDLLGPTTAVPSTAIKTESILGSTITKIPGVDQTIKTVTTAADGTITNTVERITGGGVTIKTSNIPTYVKTLPGLPPKYQG